MEIKFVANGILNMLNKSVTNLGTSAEIGHDNLISKNFWGYVKRFFKKSNRVTACMHHLIWHNARPILQKTFAVLNPNRKFTIPSWIPKF